MKQCLLNHLNATILKRASKLEYIVKAEAPSTANALFSQPSLVIWSGASDASIYQDARVNYAFRALHDAFHLETGLGFTPGEEIEMGRRQASQFEGILADIVYCEVAMQAAYYLQNGLFVSDQVAFLKQNVKGL